MGHAVQTGMFEELPAIFLLDIGHTVMCCSQFGLILAGLARCRRQGQHKFCPCARSIGAIFQTHVTVMLGCNLTTEN